MSVREYAILYTGAREARAAGAITVGGGNAVLGAPIHAMDGPEHTNQSAFQKSAEKGQADGYAPLDGDGLVPLANLPAIPAPGITVEQSGDTPIPDVTHLVLDGATVTDDGDGQVTISGFSDGGGAYAETIGDGIEDTFAIVHDLGTTDVVVALWDLTGTDPMLATGDADTIEATDADTVTVAFAAPPAADAYRVVVVAGGSTGGGGGGGGGHADIALCQPYTLSKTPNGTYPNRQYGLNGSLQAGLLTAPPGSRFLLDTFGSGVSVGWRLNTELSPDGYVHIDFDFGADVTVAIARATGMYNTSNQVVHPAGMEVFSSPDGSSWTSWAVVSGISATALGSGSNQWFVLQVSAAAVAARYWRIRVVGGNSGSGDRWLMLHRVHLLGAR